MTEKKAYLPCTWAQWVYVVALLVLTAANLPGLKKEIARINGFQREMPHQEIGQYFQPLQDTLKGVEIMGYYTDVDLKQDQEAAKDFAQAQFILAPTVLDLNNLTHEYTFFNCKDPRRALYIIKQLGLTPLKGNPRGMILARRP